MTGTTDTGVQEEIRAYAAAVRGALADAPPEQRDELLEDLEEHLAEVAAEDGDRSLAARLGPPEEYARELRAAAGIGGATRAPVGGRRGLGPAWERLRSSRPAVEVLRFLPELRPAWWVLRAWGAVTAVAVVFVDSSSFPLPTLGLGVVGVALAVAAVVWSVRLGMRSRAAGTAPGPPAVALNALLAVLTLVAVAGVATPRSASAEPVYVDQPPRAGLTHDDGAPITNIYPYSSDGEPLTGVRLYDQDGRPIDDLGDLTADGEAVEPVPDAPPQLGNVFPQQRQVVIWDESEGPVGVPMEVPADPGPGTAGPTSTGTPSPAK